MRDALKNESYYKNYLQFLNKTLIRFECLAESYGGRKGNRPLRKYYMDKMSVLYSSGAEIALIKEVYPKFLDCFIHTWTTEDGFEILLNTVSLAVLLNMKKVDMNLAMEFFEQENINDYAIDYLLHSIDQSWDIGKNPIRYPVRYAMLKDIISSRSIAVAKDYLNKWYELHKDAAWYDSHKSKEDIYTGYWSYEVGAIIKVLGLNDLELQNQSYYPYDLVHF